MLRKSYIALYYITNVSVILILILFLYIIIIIIYIFLLYLPILLPCSSSACNNFVVLSLWKVAKRLIHFWWNLKSDPKCWFTNNYSDWDFRVRITNHKSFDLDRYFRARLWINRFRSGLQNEDHESFDLDQNFGAGLWIIIQIWSVYHKLFDSNWGFLSMFANHLISTRRLEKVHKYFFRWGLSDSILWIIWVCRANHLIQIGTLERISLIMNTFFLSFFLLLNCAKHQTLEARWF